MPLYSFHIEHILPRKHGGTDKPRALAWSCHHCNLAKSSNLSGRDSADEYYVGKEVELTGKVVRISRSKYAAAENAGQDYVLELDQEKAGRGHRADVDLLLFFSKADRPKLAMLKPGETVTATPSRRNKG